jgi:hypothetical protein
LRLFPPGRQTNKQTPFFLDDEHRYEIKRNSLIIRQYKKQIFLSEKPTVEGNQKNHVDHEQTSFSFFVQKAPNKVMEKKHDTYLSLVVSLSFSLSVFRFLSQHLDLIPGDNIAINLDMAGTLGQMRIRCCAQRDDRWGIAATRRETEREEGRLGDAGAIRRGISSAKGGPTVNHEG